MEVYEKTTQQRIEALLRPNLKFLPDGDPISADAKLGDLGLDSLASINVLYDLESEFGITIPDDLLDENSFTSIANLEKMLSPLIGA